MTRGEQTAAPSGGDQRLRRAFAAARGDGRAALVCYLVCGHPEPAPRDMARLVAALARGGADVIELGVPFSDPLADGPVIERAGAAALAGGMSVAGCIETVREARALGVDVPIVLMGYLNPLLASGLEQVCGRAARAGVDGFIVADLPLEEAGDLRDAADRSDVALIQLVTPVTGRERMARIAGAGRGFTYCVARTGTTGASTDDTATEDVPGLVERVRGAAPTLPVAVGFGIATPDDVRSLAPHVDGVVVGSALVALVDVVEADEREATLERAVRALRDATTVGA